MFEKLIENENVQDLLKEIFNNPRYYEKNVEEVLKNDYFLHERILFVFYDSLYKYQLLITEEEYFDEFITSIELLLKKFDNIDDIRFGISKLIGTLLMKKKNILKDDIEDKKDIILNYVYEEYIKNGYYIRGLNKKDFLIDYKNKKINKQPIKEEVYKLAELLEKYNYNIFDNEKKKINFNTDFTNACLESVNAPYYLYNLVTDKSYINKGREAYYLKDYDLCFKNFNKLLTGLGVNDKDKEDIIDLFDDIWKSYNDDSNNIYLTFFRRSEINKAIDYNKRDDFTFDEALYNLFTAYEDFYSTEDASFDIEYFVELPGYCNYKVKKKNESTKEKVKLELVDEDFKLKNKYGKVTMFLVIGALLIIIGVMVTVVLNL